MNAPSGSALQPIAEFIRAQIGSAEPRSVLLVGGIGSGKTSTGLRLLSLLRSYGISVGGILAPRILRDEETIGYSIIDLATNATHPFAGLGPAEIRVGKFTISADALALADRIVQRAIEERPVVFVDEVGRLELGGGGHAGGVRALVESAAVPVLLVRDTLAEQVVRSFRLREPFVVRAAEVREAIDLAPAGARTFWQIVDSIPYPLLVTLCHRDGFPHSRPMHLVDHDTRTMWFATSRASRKVSQIAENPHVTVLFVDSARYNYAAFHGLAHVVEDAERQRTLWRNEWQDDWPTGPSDPDYILIRVDGVRGHFLRGYTGESGEIELD